MRRPWHLLTLVCLLGALAAPAPAALAANHSNHRKKNTPAKRTDRGNTVINDCYNHGQLTGTYTKAQLRHALAVMSPATKQYSNCFDVINQALVNGVKSSGKGGGGGGGGSFLPTPVIIVIVVLVLAAVSFGGLAIRRRRAGPTGGDDEPMA